MREILFRAKRIDNGKWVEGNDIMHKTVRGKLCLANVGEDWVCVEPETFGQYTGLNDKNGKRIFEGDIVRCGTGRICKVTFFISSGVSGFDLVPIGGFDAPQPHKWELFSDTKVIGNIHDNPELCNAYIARSTNRGCRISESMKAYREKEKSENGYCYNGRGERKEGAD